MFIFAMYCVHYMIFNIIYKIMSKTSFVDEGVTIQVLLYKMV